MSKPVRIFSTLWGQKHVDWFEKSCARSLAWPLNKAAIESANWSIHTKSADEPKIREIVAKFFPIERVKFYKIHDQAVNGSSPEMGRILLEAFLATMSETIKNGEMMLIAPPDTIFGDGTIPNLIHLGNQGKNRAIAVVHPRVNTTIFGPLGSQKVPVENGKLVTMAWRNLHKSWVDAEAGLKQNNSFVGGVSWTKLPSATNLISVTHRLPTVYLAEFLPSDLTYFQQPHDNLPPTFGAIDHGWPGDCLIDTERQRLVGSSDIGFIVEVTGENDNVPPLINANPYEPDSFWRNLKHNKMNRLTSVLFRGE